MRKHKSVVAILLAVMMIFTFMPTMAFAKTDDVTWAKDYSTVTVEKPTGNVTFNTIRTFLTTGDSAGMVQAVADTSDYEGELPTEKLTTYYYDLNKSEFGLQNDHAPIKGTYDSLSTWTSKGQVRGLVFSAPSYVKNNTETAKVYVSFQLPGGQGLNTFGDWEGSVKYTLDGEDYSYTALNAELAKASDDKTFNVWLDVDFDADATAKTPIYGAVPSKDVTIKAPVKGNPDNALFFMDKIDAKATVSDTDIQYDGAEHTVVVTPVKGFTVKWEVYNDKTGEWDSKDAVKVKDVTVSKGISARAAFYDDSITGTQTPKYERFKVYVSANATPDFQKVADSEAKRGAPADADYVVTVGTEYDPYSFVEAVASGANPSDEAKNAVTANQTELLAYFKDYTTASVETKKATPDYDTVTIKKNTKLTDAEVKALDKKYATLLTNMNLAKEGASVDNVTYVVYRAPASTDYEVTFTNAISKKTFKGKTTTKKGKLKKDQTIQFTAEAANGVAVVYKLIDVNTSKIKIDSTTGSLTLKKGLAKGTYKFKVKAYVPNKNVDGEIQNVTIKVKK